MLIKTTTNKPKMLYYLSDFKWYNSYMNDTTNEFDAKYTPMHSGRLKQKRPKYRFFCTCGRAFNQQKYINFHKRWECGRNIQCSICFRKFNTKSYFSLHMRKQHPDVEPII